MADLSTRLRRLLFLVPYVAKKPDGVEIDQLAAELEIDRDKLMEDINLLTQVGPPGGDPGEFLLVSVEEDKVYVDLAQSLTRPLRLTPAEGCSLLLGLQGLKDSGIVPYDEALASAERKLLKALGPEAQIATDLAEGTVVAGEGEAIAKSLRQLHMAARQRQCLEIEYTSASSGPSRHVGPRGVAPYGIVHHNGYWYVVGRDMRHDDLRTFRVDRISSLKVTDQRFEIPRDFDLDTYRRERLFVPSADATRVRIRFDALGATRVGQAWPAGELTRFPDGGAELAIDCEGLEWVVGWVLEHGRHAEIVAPPEARRAVVERIDAMVAAHA